MTTDALAALLSPATAWLAAAFDGQMFEFGVMVGAAFVSIALLAVMLPRSS